MKEAVMILFAFGATSAHAETGYDHLLDAWNKAELNPQVINFSDIVDEPRELSNLECKFFKKSNPDVLFDSYLAVFGSSDKDGASNIAQPEEKSKKHLVMEAYLGGGRMTHEEVQQWKISYADLFETTLLPKEINVHIPVNDRGIYRDLTGDISLKFIKSTDGSILFQGSLFNEVIEYGRCSN